MITIRRAAAEDLDFLAETDLLGEGLTPDPNEPPMTEMDRAAHWEKIATYINLPSEGAWIAEDAETGQKVGLVMALFHDRQHEEPNEANTFIYRFLEESIFPADGRFCEVFNLWVHPDYRRQGLGTRLKQVLEEETRRRGMKMIYTHTEERNKHVIELNRKLGYQAVRCGPIWDSVPRVSLVKWLE